MTEPEPAGPGIDLVRAAHAVEELLASAGYDPADPRFDRTASRVAEFVAEAWPGTRPLPVLDPTARIRATGDDSVLLSGIPFRSVCEHHLLPFTGTATIVYLPGDWIVGIGRLVDLVDGVARRLQIQERLVEQIADAVHHGLEARGTLVLTRATHSCLWARGVGNPDTELAATAVRGVYEDAAWRSEAIALVAAGRSAHS